MKSELSEHVELLQALSSYSEAWGLINMVRMDPNSQGRAAPSALLLALMKADAVLKTAMSKVLTTARSFKPDAVDP